MPDTNHLPSRCRSCGDVSADLGSATLTVRSDNRYGATLVVTCPTCRGEIAERVDDATTRRLLGRGVPVTRVATSVAARGILPNGNLSAPFQVTFRYDTADPVAIHATFPAGAGASTPNMWSFARDLLTDVVVHHRDAGEGDVRLWPVAADPLLGDAGGLRLALGNANGNATIALSREALQVFHARTAVLVPLGTEFDRVDVDAELDALLA